MKHLNVGLLLRSLLVLSGGCLALACAASDRDSEPASRARSEISGGHPDSVDSNVFLLVSQRGAAGVALCSASLIAPNLLLTARHCVSDVPEGEVSCGQVMASDPLPVNALFAANEQSADDVSTPYRAAAVSVPSARGDICGNDIALVTLTTNVPASAATPLVPRIDRAVARGELYSAVGYGLDAVGEQGVAGLRRARAGLSVSCMPGRCGQGVEPSEFVGQVGVCSGDSGGPALDEAGKVVGVVSPQRHRLRAPRVRLGSPSWKEWIRQIAREAAEQGQIHCSLLGQNWAERSARRDRTGRGREFHCRRRGRWRSQVGRARRHVRRPRAVRVGVRLLFADQLGEQRLLRRVVRSAERLSERERVHGGPRRVRRHAEPGARVILLCVARRARGPPRSSAGAPALGERAPALDRKRKRASWSKRGCQYSST